MTCPSCHGTRRVLLFTSTVECLDCATPADPLDVIVDYIAGLEAPANVLIIATAEQWRVLHDRLPPAVLAVEAVEAWTAFVGQARCVGMFPHRVDIDALRGRTFARAFVSEQAPEEAKAVAGARSVAYEVIP